MFQSTRPRGARPRSPLMIFTAQRFNPRAHAGRDDADIIIFIYRDVSIHAPTRGATFAIVSIVNPGEFQSTRPRGARPAQFHRRMDRSGFQSTRPRGARHAIRIERFTASEFQSTRPRGARLNPVQLSRFVALFQSTRPRGARRKSGAAEKAHGEFQSTRPRGARHEVVTQES